MPTAEARIRTHRTTRYLTQLCRHTAQAGALDHKHRHRQPVSARLEVGTCRTERTTPSCWGDPRGR